MRVIASLRSTTVAIPRRRGVRRFAATHQGVILHGLQITWRCGHAHDEKNEAQACANHEARQRGIPTPFDEELAAVGCRPEGGTDGRGRSDG